VAVRFEAACATLPLPVVSSLAGTFPLLRCGSDHHQTARGADLPHRIVVGWHRAAAALDLRAVLPCLTEIGLLDLDLAPVDVELVGDDLRQRRPDALAGLRILREDREGVVRIDRDVGGRCERPLMAPPGPGACANASGAYIPMTTPPPARAVTCRNSRRSSCAVLDVFVFFMTTPSARRWPRGEWLP